MIKLWKKFKMLGTLGTSGTLKLWNLWEFENSENTWKSLRISANLRISGNLGIQVKKICTSGNVIKNIKMEIIWENYRKKKNIKSFHIRELKNRCVALNFGSNFGGETINF